MRKKLDTRFPASRIKKIMQADEDIGKIALAVPVLVSKALELFLQDLCDRTYDITLQRGVKTMSALHLKQCVHSFNVFDFLKDIVNKVPDLGGSDAGGEDRSVKRRKAADEDNDSDEETKRSRIHETAGHSGRGRGRGRGRGLGGRGARGAERENTPYDKYEDDPGTSPHHDEKQLHPRSETVDGGFTAGAQKGAAVSDGRTGGGPVRNFDLNLDLDENGDAAAGVATASGTKKDEMKHEEYPGWSLSEMDRMGISPLQLALSSQIGDEEEEDYDNEEG